MPEKDDETGKFTLFGLTSTRRRIILQPTDANATRDVARRVGLSTLRLDEMLPNSTAGGANVRPILSGHRLS
jgi:hypothetical protein